MMTSAIKPMYHCVLCNPLWGFACGKHRKGSGKLTGFHSCKDKTGVGKESRDLQILAI
jgi:hypothetical protein